MRLRLLFAWYDLWVGAFWDRKARTLYLALVPMIVLAIEMGDDMEREPSEGSSNIASVGYDDDAGEMEVEFRGGSVYRYACPRQVFEEWKDAGFRGRHFHRNVKSLFEGVKQPRERDPIDG